MTDLLTRLATLPAVCAAAEEQARADYEAYAAEYGTRHRHLLRPWGTHFDGDAVATDAALSRLLDPLNPAAEGVLADLYRRATGRESAHADPVTDDDRSFSWQIVHLSPAVGMAQMPAWVDIDGTQAPTRYEAWARALVAAWDARPKT